MMVQLIVDLSPEIIKKLDDNKAHLTFENYLSWVLNEYFEKGNTDNQEEEWGDDE